MLLAVFFMLILGFVAGCGGSESESQDNGGSGNDGSGSDAATEEAARESGAGTTQQQGGETGLEGDTTPKVKIALGRIVSVDVERRRLVLMPVEGERQVFRVVRNARVAVDDVPAELSALEQGQQAQIRYATPNVRNRARTINAFNATETSQ